MDLERKARTRLTFDPAIDVAPGWSPDGSHVLFANTGATAIREKPSNGTGEERVLLKLSQTPLLLDVSRDGKFLLYSVIGKGSVDLWTLPLSGDPKPEVFLATEQSENQARFSPDGRWVAYTSDESSRAEIYVQPFPRNRDGGGMGRNCSPWAPMAASSLPRFNPVRRLRPGFPKFYLRHRSRWTTGLPRAPGPGM